MSTAAYTTGPFGDLSPGARTLVLFHRDADGFASAFAAWCALGTIGVRYVSVQYDEPLPLELQPGRPAPGRVYIVDFSYPRAMLEMFAAQGVGVTVLDHHKSAVEELKQFPPPADLARPRPSGHGYVECLFDMTKAGSELAWAYFAERTGLQSPAPELLAEPMPEFICAIATRDLWKHVKLPPAECAGVESICARMEIEPWNFERWADLAYAWDRLSAGLHAEGAAIMEYKRLIARTQSEKAHLLQLRGRGGAVIACNAAWCASETARALLAANPFHDVAAVYAWEAKGLRVSLRSRNKEDCTIIAQAYGGGGHASAAGFFYPAALPRLAGTATDSTDSIHVPGTWFCPKCGFECHKNILHAQSGAVTVDDQEKFELCPNDMTRMERLTWKAHAEGLEKAIGNWADRLGAIREAAERNTILASEWVLRVADMTKEPPRLLTEVDPSARPAERDAAGTVAEIIARGPVQDRPTGGEEIPT